MFNQHVHISDTFVKNWSYGSVLEASYDDFSLSLSLSLSWVEQLQKSIEVILEKRVWAVGGWKAHAEPPLADRLRGLPRLCRTPRFRDSRMGIFCHLLGTFCIHQDLRRIPIINACPGSFGKVFLLARCHLVQDSQQITGSAPIRGLVGGTAFRSNETRHPVHVCP